jgi:xanthine dehydrogenase accessory factor
VWYETLYKWTQAGEPCALLTVVDATGSTPRGVGSKMVVDAKGTIDGSIGGGVVEHISLQEASKAILENRPISLRFSLAGDEWKVTDEKTVHALCGGAVSVLIEPILPCPEVVLFGGGHIAEKLARLCDVVGLPYRVYDDRPEFASRERFPNARSCVCASYGEIVHKIALTRTSYCVIMTHGHAHDEVCLEAVARDRSVPYIGMIGSSKKVGTLVQNVRSRGVEIDSRFYSPIGLRLGGKLPEEIALSILAEIKLVMQGGSPAHCRLDFDKR